MTQENDDILKSFHNKIEELQGQLKPCPFCGSMARAEDFEDGMGYQKSWCFHIVCENRKCRSQFISGLDSSRYSDRTYKEVMENNIEIVINTFNKWNTRSIEGNQ